MQKKLVNPTYSYNGNDVVTVSATLEVLTDAGGVIATTTLTASYNVTAVDFPQEMRRQMVVQGRDFIRKLLEVDTWRQRHFPASSDIDSAVGQLVTDVDAAIGGA